MKVADLQQLLDDIGRLLATAGAKSDPLKELTAFRQNLAPFSNRSLKELTALLVQADAAARGETVQQKTTRSRGGGTRKKDSPDPAMMASEVRALYERAADPSVTETDVDALMAKLESMGKDGLVSVAAALELKVGSRKSKPDIIGEIRKRILARRSANQRSHIIESHGQHGTTSEENGEMARQEPTPASNLNGAD